MNEFKMLAICFASGVELLMYLWIISYSSHNSKFNKILNLEEKHINGLCDYPKEVCFFSWKRVAVLGLQG